MERIKFIAIALLFILTRYTSNAQTAEVVLKSGTPILLEVCQQLDSKNNISQSSFDLRVKFDVKVDDKVIIRAGTIAKGQVVMAKKAKGCGKPGIIEIKAINVNTVDGQTVHLYSSSIKMEGKNKAALAWGLSVGGCLIISPLSFFFLLIKGEEGIILAATSVDAQATSNITIKVE